MKEDKTEADTSQALKPEINPPHGRILGMVRAALSLIYPPVCIACKHPMAETGNPFICKDCIVKIKAIPSPQCSICGFPIEGQTGNVREVTIICGDCKLHKKQYDLARSVCYYNETLREIIHSFKFNSKIGLTAYLAHIMSCKYVEDDQFGNEDVIIPVPMHISRIRKRGYNQSELLVERIALLTGLPLEKTAIRRIRNTAPLYEMTREERAKILKGAFKIIDGKIFKGKTVLLIDDIYTTGATSNEVARALKRAGAIKVNVLTLAKAGLPGNS